MSKAFTLPQAQDELDQKETNFETFLKTMLIYTEKHRTRIEKYIRGSAWIDHLHHLENPLAM